jgi:hypothetical protein
MFALSAGIRPSKCRAAVINFDVPGAALVASGVVYRPPAAGAVIAHASMTADAEAASQWRWQLTTEAALVTSTPAGNVSTRPLWPGGGYDITGVAQGYQFFGIGDGVKHAQGIPLETPVLVIPGNLFIMALTLANLQGEGGFMVYEFLNPDEFERWNASRDV